MSSHGSPPAANLFRKLAQQWPAPGQIAYADRSVEKPVAMFATKSSKVETDSSRRTELATEAALEEGVFLRCAGIVLLHPFLPRFFEGLGIARNNKLIQPERALGLLHFLATGHRTAPEYDLLLPKLLCGCMNTVVPLQIDLTPEEEEESDALLNAMIRHWDALGATSVEGLRGSYLVRPGKLSSRGEDYVLQVESRAYDILLDQLPWGIGLIKLPWMESTLWVEWRM